ncbi:S-adenosyl-L-methionine-dependent methyltransferase [Ophiobolus disseminans]|uniref:S-adenosyl-L-methionine-dependent methyltransferase n=1 Tax=Ophiobolus disseminans TaxID=1469910 RepID=A0A6A7A5D9_9PLEO|nr:S-adenosyl-L-methionine-dependent methyltransferase [Ophiobolus disseminans]
MSCITHLSENIAKNTALVGQWLASQNAKELTFEQDATAEFPDTVGEPNVEKARLAILDDTKTLHDLIAGPGEVLRRICWGSVDNSAQQCIYHFNVLGAVPLDGGATYDEISTKTNLSTSQLKALVRQSATNRVLREDDPEHVVHTASSALLLKDPAMMDWYGHTVEEMFPAGAKLAQALENTAATKVSAFGLAFGTHEPIYTFLEKHPARQARFFGAMEGVGRDYGHSLEHIVNGYPWAQLQNATVVDVGGSSGFMSVALAMAHPNLIKVIVQDYKHTIEEGAAQLPSNLVGRVSFMAHDFFNQQPLAAADVYIMRHVCHNWSTDNCAKIIANIAAVMSPQSKLLLVEVVVLPSNQEESSVAERYMRNLDVAMLQMLNTQERSESEWREVVRSADTRLELTSFVRPKGSWDSIIEISMKE